MEKMLSIGTTVKVKPLGQIKQKFHGKVGHVTRIQSDNFGIIFGEISPFMYEVSFRGVYVDESFLFTEEELVDVWAPDFDLHFPLKGEK